MEGGEAREYALATSLVEQLQLSTAIHLSVVQIQIPVMASL